MSLVMYGLYERRANARWCGEPFYLGVGTHKRPKRQLYDLRLQQHNNADVQKVYDRHLLQGLEPEIRILATLPNWQYATELEKKAIKLFGRRSRADERGCLCNLASGGQGPDPELMRSPAIAAKNSAAQRQSYADSPTRRAAISQHAVERNKRPEVQAARSKASKEMNMRTWADPEVRQRRITNMQGVKKTVSEVSLRQRRDALKKAAIVRHTKSGSSAVRS